MGDDIPVEIIPNLFLGDRNAAKNKPELQAKGITHIVNVTLARADGGVHNFFENCPPFEYLRVPVQDTDNENLSPWFESTFHFIESARSAHTGVLVHCQMGVSRSPTIILAYLMRKERMSLMDAYALVRTRRAEAKPKANFLLQLKALERRLTGAGASSTVSASPCPSPTPSSGTADPPSHLNAATDQNGAGGSTASSSVVSPDAQLSRLTESDNPAVLPAGSSTSPMEVADSTAPAASSLKRKAVGPALPDHLQRSGDGVDTAAEHKHVSSVADSASSPSPAASSSSSSLAAAAAASSTGSGLVSSGKVYGVSLPAPPAAGSSAATSAAPAGPAPSKKQKSYGVAMPPMGLTTS